MGDVPGARPRQLRGARPARHPPAARGRSRTRRRRPCKTALELQPGSARAYQILGDIYARAEQTDQAILHYRKALEIDAGNVRVRLALGEVLLAREAAAGGARRGRGRARAPTPQNRFALDLKGRCAARPAPLRRGRRPRPTRCSRGDRKRPQGRLPQGDDRRGAPRLRQGRGAARGDPGPRAPASRRGGGRNERVFLVHLGFAYQQLERYADAAQAFGPRHRRPATRRTRTCSASTPRRSRSPRTRTRRSPRRARRAQRFPDDLDLAALEATILREKGDTAAAHGHRRGAARRSRRPTRRCSAAWPTSTGAPESFPEAEAALRQALAVDPKNLARAVPARGGARAPEAPRRRPRRSSARRSRSSPTPRPVLNYLGYMNADRNVRVEEALTLDPEGGGARPRERRLPGQPGLGAVPAEPARGGRARRCGARSSSDGDNAVILDHLGDILARRGRVAEALVVLAEGAEGRGRRRESSTARAWRRRSVRPRGLSQAQQQSVAAAHALSSRSLAAPRSPPARRPAAAAGRCRRARAAPRPPGRGSLRVSVQRPGRCAAARQALVAFRRPDAVRIEIPGPAGRAPRRGGPRRTPDRRASRPSARVLESAATAERPRGAAGRRALSGRAHGPARGRGSRGGCARYEAQLGRDAAAARRGAPRRRNAPRGDGRRRRGRPRPGRGRLRSAAPRRLSRDRRRRGAPAAGGR